MFFETYLIIKEIIFEITLYSIIKKYSKAACIKSNYRILHINLNTILNGSES